MLNIFYANIRLNKIMPSVMPNKFRSMEIVPDRGNPSGTYIRVTASIRFSLEFSDRLKKL